MKHYFSFLIFSYCLLFINTASSGQCVNSNFTVSSPVCTGSFLQFTNNSTGANSYQWDFAPGYFGKPAAKLTDTILPLTYPGDITLMEENDTTMLFISGLANGYLYRLIYGNGPGNPVTQVDNFGNLGALYQPSDITFYKSGSDWYGFVVDYGNNYLYRIYFGNSLKNAPGAVTTLLTNTTSNFNAPWSIKLSEDSTGSIFGLVGNFGNGTLTVLSFGNSILNTPTPGAQIPVTGTGNAFDVALARNCGNWYAFIAGGNSSNVIRADFGNSLLNAPTFTTIISNGSPSDIYLVNDSSHWKLMYTNYSSYDLKKYDLGSSLTNNSPQYLGSDYFNGGNPKGVCGTKRGNESFLYMLYSSSNNVQSLGYINNVPVSQFSSTDSVPAGIYFTQAGSYPVTLSAIDAQGIRSSYTDTVFVTQAPQSSFSTVNFCLGDSTLFTDSSVINSGSIASWNWDFGDGNTSVSRNTGHTYAATGNYTARLVTTSIYGCADTASQTLHISAIPNTSFAYPPAACSLTNMQFTDQTTVAGDSIVQWFWNFGNGQTSAVRNPFYSFPTGGTFNIRLTTISSAGCSDSDNVTLTFAERPLAGFSTDNTCLGQTVQFNDKTVINNSSITNYHWNFGDGNTDSLANPQHQYASSVAVYFAQLIVTAANGCRDTLNRSVKINNPPVVNFSLTPVPACENNDVFFTDLSTVSGDTISEWHWDFGDSEIDSIKNPVHRFTAPGQYTVTLTSYSPSRCPGIPVQQVVDVKASPTASFTFPVSCLGTVTHFTNTSIPASGSTIDSALWYFGTTDSSTIYEPDYQFPSAGNFNVNLTVISQEGCKGIYSQTVQIHDKPGASFTSTLPCTNDTVYFSNTSTCDSLSHIIFNGWNFGDPASGIANNSTIIDPGHRFPLSQSYTVSLITTTEYGCKDTAVMNLNVNPSPPASFTYAPTCKGDLMQFTNPGTPTDVGYLWDFGDNQTNLLREPIHNYLNDGIYPVSLSVTSNMGCVTVKTMNVTVSPIPIANFATKPACIHTDYAFEDSSTISMGNIAYWDWTIQGLASPDTVDNPTYVFTVPGNYPVKLTVTSDVGCSSSITKTISVYGPPISNFSFNPQFGNPPLTVNITDNATGAALYTWDFGDGTAQDTIQEPVHIYTDTGVFVIRQYVVSPFGCTDSSSKNIYVIKPLLDIAIAGDSSYLENGYFHVVCKLKNLGTREITSLQMEAKIENGNTIREFLNEVIPNGPAGYKTYAFHAAFQINAENAFRYYCVSALHPNGEEDSNPENNEHCYNLSDESLMFAPYPNPFSTNLNLYFLLGNADFLKVDLFDFAGRLVREIYNGKSVKNYVDIQTNLSELKEGIYTLRAIYRDKVFTKTVVKNKPE